MHAVVVLREFPSYTAITSGGVKATCPDCKKAWRRTGDEASRGLLRHDDDYDEEGDEEHSPGKGAIALEDDA